MLRTILGSIFAVTLGAACGAAPDDDLDVGGKADDAARTGRFPVRLERATAEEVAAAFAARVGRQLDNCFAEYRARVNPEAKVITLEVARRFRSNYPFDGSPTADYCADWFDVAEVVAGVFQDQGRERAYPDEIKEWMPEWALAELAPHAVDGAIELDRGVSLIFYDDIEGVKDANAAARAKDPAGVDLDALRAAWATVRQGTTLDRDLFNAVILDPAKLDGDALFPHLREAFPRLRGLAFVSARAKAIDDFWRAHEGPEGDPAFAPIAEMLAQPSITKVFFFSRTGEWSSNVLVFVDEHGQAHGLQMGYSE